LSIYLDQIIQLQTYSSYDSLYIFAPILRNEYCSELANSLERAVILFSL